MNSLTAVIITKNEEKRIRRCLESLKGLADEIVVVDDESTDKTVDIAKNEFGAKIVVNKLGTDFDRQRNLGIEAASCEWILSLDADEVFPKESIVKIKEALQVNKDYDAFNLIRKDCIFTVPLNYVGNYKAVKLFRKGKAVFKVRIHEALNVDGKIGNIDAFILHYNYDSVSEILKRWNFYTDIQSKDYIENNDKISLKYLKSRLLYKSVMLFYTHYIKHKGFKDGVYGLIWSILNTLHPLVLWLKILERGLKNNKISR